MTDFPENVATNYSVEKVRELYKKYPTTVSDHPSTGKVYRADNSRIKLIKLAPARLAFANLSRYVDTQKDYSTGIEKQVPAHWKTTLVFAPRFPANEDSYLSFLYDELGPFMEEYVRVARIHGVSLPSKTPLGDRRVFDPTADSKSWIADQASKVSTSDGGSSPKKTYRGYAPGGVTVTWKVGMSDKEYQVAKKSPDKDSIIYQRLPHLTVNAEIDGKRQTKKLRMPGDESLIDQTFYSGAWVIPYVSLYVSSKGNVCAAGERLHFLGHDKPLGASSGGIPESALDSVETDIEGFNSTVNLEASPFGNVDDDDSIDY